MTIKEFLTNILQRNREMVAQAKESEDFMKAVKSQGAIEITELIWFELYKSDLFEKEI